MSANAVTEPSQIDITAHEAFLNQFIDLYSSLFAHDGFGDIRIEIKILRRGQKEVIIHCGKQYRYVIDCDQALANESMIKHLLKRDLLA
ncbi:hypothetical protein [Motiliproteus coralliicola]|uniref:hypothetical protein n=1 Tax=Motiliproteus coralliicola TaxID=2283196 RepID=UPI001A9CCDA9|nr:hypothetical protein [Motiliproteus coralliicola]